MNPSNVKIRCRFGRMPFAIVASGALAKLTPAEIRTYALLCGHAGRSWSCYPGNKRLATLSGLTVRGVIKALKGLRAKGLIVRVVAGGGAGHRSVYELATVPPDTTKGERAFTLKG